MHRKRKIEKGKENPPPYPKEISGEAHDATPQLFYLCDDWHVHVMFYTTDEGAIALGGEKLPPPSNNDKGTDKNVSEKKRVIICKFLPPFFPQSSFYIHLNFHERDTGFSSII